MMVFGRLDFSDLGLRILVALDKALKGLFQEDK